MDNRVEQAIRTAFRRTAEPWFPGLGEPLSQTAWRRLAKRGFCLSNYGTHRWLRDDPSAERCDVVELVLGDQRKCHVEVLPPSSRARYERLGLVFPDSARVAEDTSAVATALSFVALVPNLLRTVTAYLCILHILQAPSADHDVSHSDPDIPFSIFLSVPSNREQGHVRLAESIIHECMHLQLTMIENMVPLVACEARRSFSPWQRSLRPLGGVIHGLYVFAVVDAYYRIVQQAPSLTTAERRFVNKRRRDLVEEVGQVGDLTTGCGLTADGKALFDRLVQQFRSSDAGSAQVVVSHGAEL